MYAKIDNYYNHFSLFLLQVQCQTPSTAQVILLYSEPN